MPASAPQMSGDEHPVAEVIDFAARRAAQRRGEQNPAQSTSRPSDEEIAVADAWRTALADRGVSLNDPTVRASVAGVADLMERLVLGARSLRQSDSSEGLDETSAQVMLDVLADLRGASATLDALRDSAEEC